jgi:hypothetical protein
VGVEGGVVVTLWRKKAKNPTGIQDDSDRTDLGKQLFLPHNFSLQLITCRNILSFC